MFCILISSLKIIWSDICLEGQQFIAIIFYIVKISQKVLTRTALNTMPESVVLIFSRRSALKNNFIFLTDHFHFSNWPLSFSVWRGVEGCAEYKFTVCGLWGADSQPTAGASFVSHRGLVYRPIQPHTVLLCHTLGYCGIVQTNALTDPNHTLLRWVRSVAFPDFPRKLK